jgi:hypothetical protein
MIHPDTIREFFVLYSAGAGWRLRARVGRRWRIRVSPSETAAMRAAKRKMGA